MRRVILSRTRTRVYIHTMKRRNTNFKDVINEHGVFKVLANPARYLRMDVSMYSPGYVKRLRNNLKKRKYVQTALHLQCHTDTVKVDGVAGNVSAHTYVACDNDRARG